MKRQITPRFVLILIRGAVLSGYVGVAKLVGLDPKQLLVHNRDPCSQPRKGAIRLRIRGRDITPLPHRQSLI